MSSTARWNCRDIAGRFPVAAKLRLCQPATFLSDPPPFCGQPGTVSGGKRAQIGTRKSALDTDQHHANFALGQRDRSIFPALCSVPQRTRKTMWVHTKRKD